MHVGLANENNGIGIDKDSITAVKSEYSI